MRGVDEFNRMATARSLARALDEDELVVHYLPKAELPGGKVRSAEALLRWQHPKRGLLAPAEFIAQAEQSGVIGPLTLAVIDKALGQAASWRHLGMEIGVDVNVGARNLQLGFPEEVRTLTEKWKMDPRVLGLELSEGGLAAGDADATTVLAELANTGVRLSIDDFGTSASSLDRLRHMPLREIKIDRSFIAGVSRDESDRTLVRSIVDMTHSFGFKIVAEGVEDQEVWDTVSQLGCDFAQGYFLTRPLPAEEFVEWMRSRAAAAA